MIRQAILIIITFTILSCRESSSSLTEDEKKTIIEEVRQTLNNYYDDIRTSGLMAEFNYLDSSPGFFWVPPGFPGAISYDSVASILKQNSSLLKTVDNRFDTLRIIPLSRELAAYTARLQSSVTDTSGKTTVTTLVETGILIRRKGGWKLLNGQTSAAE